MRKFIYIFVFLSLFFISYAQQNFDYLVPKPRVAYIREVYSGLFFLSNKIIYLNPKNPAYRQAYELNQGLRNRSLDTLSIDYWNEADTLVNGIVLGTADSFINKLFEYIPDQPISISDTYPGKEGYILDVFPTQAIIAGCDGTGLHYGINTFLQLLDSMRNDRTLFACRIVDAPEYPVRWFYYPNNHLVDANIDKAKKIWLEAASYKLNGLLLTDSKFSFLWNYKSMPKYFDSLLSVKKYAQDNYLKIVPGVFSFGYSNDLLFNDPNLAAGLPVKSQRFVIQGDTGKILPKTNIVLLNPGFENHNGDNFPGFGWIDDPGHKSFADTLIKHSGSVSIRFGNFPNFYPSSPNARIYYRTRVEPYTLYHVSAWVKTENLQADDYPHITILGNKGSSLNFTNINVPWTTDWKKVDITFNTLDNDTAAFYWGVWGARNGKIWWDDLLIEEIPFVNMVRRPGAPINVDNPNLDGLIKEGVDYDTLRDPQMGVIPWPGSYNPYHQPPTFKIKPGGRLNNGDTIYISYYHTVVIYDDQVMCSMSEPETYEISEQIFKSIDSLLDADTYFMSHDEIRVMNWDYADEQRQMTPAQILADNVNRCVDIVHKYKPNADIWDWTDMFDEYHNAVAGNYYLVNGDLRGSADSIANSIGMANWNTGNHDSSLKYFSTRGFRQISAPYYDAGISHIRRWKQWTQKTPDFLGMMYTTWAADYSNLKAFSEYCWNHAPYINHYPPYDVLPHGILNLNVVIRGDSWDNTWKLDKATIHYIMDGNKEDSITFNPEPGIVKTIPLNLPDNNKSLKYYITASDTNGWVSRVPFGDDKYYILGSSPTSVGFENILDLAKLIIEPNPAISQSEVNVIWESSGAESVKIALEDLFGRIIENRQFYSNGSGEQKFRLNITQLPAGTYLVTITSKDNIRVSKFVKY
jgi:hypothetical protein